MTGFEETVLGRAEDRWADPSRQPPAFRGILCFFQSSNFAVFVVADDPARVGS